MTRFVAKIKRIYLANSRFEKARIMAGKVTKFEWKYLTEGQVNQLDRYDVGPYIVRKLTEQDFKDIERLTFINKGFHKPVLVKFKDEDGEHSIKFPNSKEANRWIAFMESNLSAGEKFEFIDMIYNIDNNGKI